MLFDAALTPVANECWFDPEQWSPAGTAERMAGGRGSVVFLRDSVRRWVLRHYRRGGAVASLLDDRYLWTGEERTRAFREWRLLKRLEAWQLPVPRAVAARYRRQALFYRADLITEELPATTTLAQTLESAPLTRRAGVPSVRVCAASTSTACSTPTSMRTTSCWVATAACTCSISIAGDCASGVPGRTPCSRACTARSSR